MHMTDKKNVCVVGAGNVGLSLLANLKKCKKFLFSMSFNSASYTQINVEENEIKIVTDYTIIRNLNELENMDIFFVTYPAFLREKFIDDFSKSIKCKMNKIICFVPGYGGSELLCLELIKEGTIICGLQRVPYISRYDKQSKRSINFSSKNELKIAALPHKNLNTVCSLLESVINIPIQPLSSYLLNTLSTTNPFLHTLGVYCLSKVNFLNESRSEEIYLYDNWNDEISTLLFSLDNEVTNITKILGKHLDMSNYIAISCYYESKNPHEFTLKLKSIKSLRMVKAPIKINNNGCYYDLNNRIFTEDFEYGLSYIKSLALLTNTMTPTLDLLLDFYFKLSGKLLFENNNITDYSSHLSIPQSLGIDSLASLINIYGEHND